MISFNDPKRKKSVKHINGVKNNNCFRDLNYFNVIDGLPPDLMHDMLEGVLPKNVSLLLKHLIETNVYSIDELNKNIREFKYGRIDKRNQIPNNFFTPNSTSSVKLSATHMWTLIRILPLIIGQRFKDDPNYKHFTLLIEIFRILNADSFNEAYILDLENKIFEYLSEFKILYPNVSVTAKMHFLVHYGRCVRKFGPPKNYSTMRFEAKHGYFKDVHEATHNTVNLTYSLSKRHQFLQLYHLLSNDFFGLDLEFGSKLKDPTLFELIRHQINNSDIILYKWINFNSIKYSCNDLILKNVNNNIPEFAKINAFLYDIDAEKIFLIVNELETVEYTKHLTGYVLKEPCDITYKLISLNDMHYNYVLDCYNLDKNNNLFVTILKYPFKN